MAETGEPVMNYKNRDLTTLRFNLNHAVLSEEGVTEDIVLVLSIKIFRMSLWTFRINEGLL